MVVSRAASLAALGTVLLLAAPVAANTFGGFSGVDRPYLVNQDRVCKPLKVEHGAATGAPSCQTAGADVVARLSIKRPVAQRGSKAKFTATASGRTITVARKTGEPVVAWQAMDPIAKIVEVYASEYDDRVAVAYSVRRMGKDMTDVVAFDLLGSAPHATDPQPPSTTPQTTPPPPADPKLTKAVAAARKARGARALSAWQAVLGLDADHAEAHYRIAAAHAAARHAADALAELDKLAGSSRSDAIEWLVEARFDRAFAKLRADPKFRAAVGLDRKPRTIYERLMGFGGQWEQTGTSCDKPEVRMIAKRDRSVSLRVKTRCQGSVFDTPFKGTWRIDGTRVVLSFPTRGKVTAEDEAPCDFQRSGDEDALRCTLGRDLDFTVLPARR